MTDLSKSNTGAADPRLGLLRSELETLEADLKIIVGDVEGIVDGRVHLAIRKAQDIAHSAYAFAEESVGNTADDVKKWAGGNLSSARNSVRTRPLLALGLSLGAGALLGAIFTRR